MMNIEKQLQELFDKQTLTEIMYKFARALDRVDGELMKSTYWEDAIEEHQDPIFPELFFYNDNAHAFVDPAMEGFRALKATQHRISNPLIEISGDTATAEATSGHTMFIKRMVLIKRVSSADVTTSDSNAAMASGRSCTVRQSLTGTKTRRPLPSGHRITMINTAENVISLTTATTTLPSDRRFDMAIPGLRKNDHWGVTVPNIAEAVSFFETHFNFKLVYSFGPFSAEDDWMKTQLNVDPRAEIKQIAMMNAGNINLELFEYSDNIPRSTRQPNNADVGGHHLDSTSMTSRLRSLI